MTPALWMPLILSANIEPVNTGSGENPSQFRAPSGARPRGPATGFINQCVSNFRTGKGDILQAEYQLLFLGALLPWQLHAYRQRFGPRWKPRSLQLGRRIQSLRIELRLESLEDITHEMRVSGYLLLTIRKGADIFHYAQTMPYRFGQRIFRSPSLCLELKHS